MHDGQIENAKAWFGFDLEDLYWLLELIPPHDGFRDEVKAAIDKIEEE